ncbi:MAG: hypothetical protein EXR62_04215 [Chloroflexi bacterium]|nr:hypothetical protein [Chloroflexota bacterium]
MKSLVVGTIIALLILTVVNAFVPGMVFLSGPTLVLAAPPINDEPSRDHDVSIEGKIQSMSAPTPPSVWVVDSHTVSVTLETEIKGTPQVGSQVKIEGRMLEDLTIVAKKIEVKDENHNEQVEFRGPIKSFTDIPGIWIIGQFTVTVSTTTHIEGTPAVGALAKGHGLRQSDGTILARQIAIENEHHNEQVEFRGLIKSFTDIPGLWVIGQFTVTVSTTTHIEGIPAVGALADVHGVRQSDGTILAKQIKVKNEDHNEQVEFRGHIKSFTDIPGLWVIGQFTVTVSTTTHIEGTPAVGALAKVHGVRQSDGTILARQIQIEHAEHIRSHVEFSGIIRQLITDTVPATWVINRITVTVGTTTTVIGDPAVGRVAEVEGLMQPDHTVLALKITVKRPETERIHFDGRIQVLPQTPGFLGTWTVGGHTFDVDKFTLIDISEARPGIGRHAEVYAVSGPGNKVIARYIKIEKDH